MINNSAGTFTLAAEMLTQRRLTLVPLLVTGIRLLPYQEVVEPEAKDGPSGGV